MGALKSPELYTSGASKRIYHWVTYLATCGSVCHNGLDHTRTASPQTGKEKEHLMASIDGAVIPVSVWYDYI